MRIFAALVVLLLAAPASAQVPAQTYTAAAKTDATLKAAYAKLDTAWPGIAAKTKAEQASFQTAQVLLRAADTARLNGDTKATKDLALQVDTALSGTKPVDMAALAADVTVGKFVSAAQLSLPQSKLDGLLAKPGKWDLVGLEPLSP